jgi:hypothetical protein
MLLEFGYEAAGEVDSRMEVIPDGQEPYGISLG